jgi:8-oxo-dGTP diphosphatase
MKTVNIAAAVIRRGTKFLVGQRNNPPEERGLWEFPGGKQEEGETLEQCLKRELLEELSITVETGNILASFDLSQDGQERRFFFFLAELRSGKPLAKVHQAVKWVTLEELSQMPLCPADRSLPSLLEKFFSRP